MAMSHLSSRLLLPGSLLLRIVISGWIRSKVIRIKMAVVIEVLLQMNAWEHDDAVFFGILFVNIFWPWIS